MYVSVDTFLENKDELPLEEQLRVLLEKMDMASQSSKTILDTAWFYFYNAYFFIESYIWPLGRIVSLTQ